MASHLTQPAPKAGETAIIEPKPESAMYIDASRTELPVDWSAAEELRAIRKVDFFILPLVMMGFFSLQIDRGNISAALTSGMRTDLNITQNTISNGQTILYLCILLGELPSNLVLQRVGAKFWLPCQMIVWGLVATIQCVITNQTGFYVCRAFLGLAESGFIPGGVYYISTLYTRQQFAKRVGLFWIGNYIGKGCSGLIAAGVFSLGDVRGFATWQWLFFIEGMMTLFIGVLNLFLLPRSTEDSRTLIPGLCTLTNRQEYILTTRLLVDNPSKKDAQKIKISLQDVAKALSNWRIYLILVFALAWTAPVSTLETYNAQIVTSLGFSTIKGNALSSVGYWAQIPIIFICGWFADRFDIRGVVIFCTAIPFIAFSAAFYYLETLDNVYIWTKYAIFQMMVAFTGSSYLMGIVWATLNSRTPTQRSIYSAMYIIFTNAGQAIGGQIFRQSDAPKYLQGMIAVLSLESVAAFLALIGILVFWYSNEKGLGETGLPDLSAEIILPDERGTESKTPKSTAGTVVIHAPFRYAL